MAKQSFYHFLGCIIPHRYPSVESAVKMVFNDLDVHVLVAEVLSRLLPDLASSKYHDVLDRLVFFGGQSIQFFNSFLERNEIGLVSFFEQGVAPRDDGLSTNFAFDHNGHEIDPGEAVSRFLDRFSDKRRCP